MSHGHEEGGDALPVMRLKVVRRLEEVGAGGDRLDLGDRVPPPVLEDVIGAGRESLEPCVDYREPELEFEDVGEEWAAVALMPRPALCRHAMRQRSAER